MLLPMSMSAARTALECIDGFGERCWPDIMFQSGAIDDIHRPLEEAGYIFFDACIVPEVWICLRIELHHDVDVAIRAIVAARGRAEQRGVRDAARPQCGLALLQSGKDLVAAHRGR